MTNRTVLTTNGQEFVVDPNSKKLYYRNILHYQTGLVDIPLDLLIDVLETAGLVTHAIAPKEDRSILGMALCVALEELTDTGNPTTLQYNYYAPTPLINVLDTDPIEFISPDRLIILPMHIHGIFEALKEQTQKVLPYSEELMRKGTEYDKLYDLYIDEQKRNETLEEENTELKQRCEEEWHLRSACV